MPMGFAEERDVGQLVHGRRHGSHDPKAEPWKMWMQRVGIVASIGKWTMAMLMSSEGI